MSLQDLGDIAQIAIGIGSILIAGLAIRASKQISAQQQSVALDASRAYLTPESALLTALSAGRPVEVTVTVKNWGQTPALRTKLDARIYLASNKTNHMRATPFKVNPSNAEIAAPPQGSLQISGAGKNGPPLTSQQLLAIHKGELMVFCDFVANYHDLAGREHETFVRYSLAKDHLSQELPISLSLGKGDLSIT